MESYLALGAYPEVPDTLARLKKSGLKLAILSNGTPEMLRSAVHNAELGSLLDAVFSVEQAGVYKPDPRVYRLAVDGLGMPREQICFVSSNARTLCRFGIWHACHLVQSQRSAERKFARRPRY